MKDYLKEGVEAAKAGKSIKSCPYKKKSEYLAEWDWRTGFQLIKPDAKTTIEDVFAPAFGGRPRRQEIWSAKVTGYVALPIDSYNPDNYLDSEGNPSEYNSVYQEHLVSHGAYDVTGLPRYYIGEAESLECPITQSGLNFVNLHGAENIYIAQAYQVYGVFLFVGKPQPLKHVKGSFGRGACVVVSDCPAEILLVEEDDE